MIEFFVFTILILGIFNLLRVSLLMIATDVHEIKKHCISPQPYSSVKNPWISILIPAYNEELSINKSIESVFKNNYKNYEVIVIDDGSSDKTSAIARKIIKKYPHRRLKLIRQKNSGKAAALNNGVQIARGSLVMCLDADSLIGSDAITKAVEHFKNNKQLLALASNVHVIPSNKPIIILQYFEYMISYRLRRGLNILNCEYIIGGVGSTFRKNSLKKIGGYDSDTMTEDIDLSMKIIRIFGNKNVEIGYGYDVNTFTQGVQSFKDLHTQRLRWKFGRMQTFQKNYGLFFSTNKKYSKTLSIFQLPVALLGDVLLLLEPIILALVIAISIVFHTLPLVWAMCFVLLFININVFNESTLSLKEKFNLAIKSPIAMVAFFVLTYIELFGLIKSIAKLIDNRSNKGDASWEHVKRIAM